MLHSCLPIAASLAPAHAWRDCLTRHPGSPEHRAAAQEFYYLLLSQKVEEVLAKAPPFTPEQRETIVARLRTAEVAPESTDAP